MLCFQCCIATCSHRISKPTSTAPSSSRFKFYNRERHHNTTTNFVTPQQFTCHNYGMVAASTNKQNISRYIPVSRLAGDAPTSTTCRRSEITRVPYRELGLQSYCLHEASIEPPSRYCRSEPLLCMYNYCTTTVRGHQQFLYCRYFWQTHTLTGLKITAFSTETPRSHYKVLALDQSIDSGINAPEVIQQLNGFRDTRRTQRVHKRRASAPRCLHRSPANGRIRIYVYIVHSSTVRTR